MVFANTNQLVFHLGNGCTTPWRVKQPKVWARPTSTGESAGPKFALS